METVASESPTDVEAAITSIKDAQLKSDAENAIKKAKEMGGKTKELNDFMACVGGAA